VSLDQSPRSGAGVLEADQWSDDPCHPVLLAQHVAVAGLGAGSVNLDALGGVAEDGGSSKDDQGGRVRVQQRTGLRPLKLGSLLGRCEGVASSCYSL